MGKLVVTEFITLDGIIEDPGGSEGTKRGGWSFRHPAPEGQQFKGEELERADAQLLGRVTYEGFAAAWPAMEESGGKRLFTSAGPDLELAETRKGGPDVLLLIYRPAKSAAD
jgi:hypothetical protein